MGKESCDSHITLEIYGQVFAKEYRLASLRCLCFDEDFALLKDRSTSILQILRVIIDLIKHQLLKSSNLEIVLENCD